MQVTKEGIERIKSANELGAVVAERGIEVKKKGRVLVGRCPFHEEKTASFTITPAKGLYHCFGCGAAGDVIGFVTKHDKVSFGSALDTLARRAGLDLAKLMESRPRIQEPKPLAALTPFRNPDSKPTAEGAPPRPLQTAAPARSFEPWPWKPRPSKRASRFQEPHTASGNWWPTLVSRAAARP